MAFTPQNFVDKVGPVLASAWLNPLDVTVNSVLAGATTPAAALVALGLPPSVPANLPALIRAVKPAATSRANTVVLANDPDLVLAVPNAGYYRFELTLNFAGGAAGATPGCQIELAFSGSLHQNSLYNYFGMVNATAASGGQTIGSAISFSLAASTANSLTIIGQFQATGAGNFALSWAQANTSASATTVSAGSYMTLQQIA